MPAPVVVASASTVGGASFAGFNHVPVTSPSSDRIFVLAVAARGTTAANTQFSTVTYSGTAFIEIDTISTSGASRRASFYYLPNSSLPSGAGPFFVNVSTANATGICVALLEITGAVQSTPSVTSQNTSTSAATSITASITTVGVESLVVDCCAASYTGTASPGPGQTEYQDNTVNTLTSGVSGKTVISPQTTSMTQSFSTSSNRSSTLLVEIGASNPTPSQATVNALAGFSF